MKPTTRAAPLSSPWNCAVWFSPLRRCTEQIYPLSEMDKLMEPISIIGNALHIYMLAFNEPNSIRSSELMAFRKVIELSSPGGEYISDCCQGGGDLVGAWLRTLFISVAVGDLASIKTSALLDRRQVGARRLTAITSSQNGCHGHAGLGEKKKRYWFQTLN